MPAVSVIIPTYNHRDFVLQALDSVFSQTFSDYEVIVVNDGSPDNTDAILAPLARSGRIRYVAQRNAGQGAARNRGLAESRGEFIAYLDDDDLWPPDKLEWQVDLLRKSNALMLGGAVALFKDGEPPLPHVPWGPDVSILSAETLAEGNPFFSPGQTLIRKSALDRVGGFDATVWGIDDYDLYLRLSKCGDIQVDHRISLLYRLHAGNASKQRQRMAENSFKVVRRHFPDDGSIISRKAVRWLYSAAGCEWISDAKKAARHFDMPAVAASLRHLLPFTSAALRDFGLARQILLDLLPIRVSRWLRRA
jgi:glycosyltransferase involved in cell wall biosynthesis